MKKRWTDMGFIRYGTVVVGNKSKQKHYYLHNLAAPDKHSFTAFLRSESHLCCDRLCPSARNNRQYSTNGKAMQDSECRLLVHSLSTVPFSTELYCYLHGVYLHIIHGFRTLNVVECVLLLFGF